MKEIKDDMAEYIAEMRADRKEMHRQWMALSNKLGHTVEDILEPNLPRLATEHFGASEVDEMMFRVSRRDPDNRDEWCEFDAIVASSELVLLGGAGVTPNVSSAEEFAAKLGTFFRHFPRYEGRRLVGVFGSWSVPKPVEQRLTELGIYCLQMGEETMELSNAPALEKGAGRS